MNRDLNTYTIFWVENELQIANLLTKQQVTKP